LVHFSKLCTELRKECEEDGNDMPNIDNWLTLRNNEHGWYTKFFEVFIVHVVGAAKFRNKVATQFVSSFVTVGDEAFALLVLENCEEKWMDMYDKKETKSYKKNKYTDGGKSSQGGRSRNLKGWSNKGLNRFNELYRLVKVDRARKDVAFEGTFLEKMKEKYLGRKRRRMEVRLHENEDDEQPDFIEDDMELTEI
jgi:hypothetical protein